MFKQQLFPMSTFEKFTPFGWLPVFSTSCSDGHDKIREIDNLPDGGQWSLQNGTWYYLVPLIDYVIGGIVQGYDLPDSKRMGA